MFNWMRLFFEWMYRFSKPPWDTGITPPEVVAWVESGGVKKGRALDLGCGTGTNAIYLAQHGFKVVGVDFSSKAIALARAKAQRAGAAIDFRVGDVTRLDFLQEPFDFVLDVGCFHGLDASGRERYAASLARLTHPGSVFMLYAFAPRPRFFRTIGLSPEQVEKTFAKNFALNRVEHGEDRERASAWYWFGRKA